jgi:signal transduction histidine kinase
MILDPEHPFSGIGGRPGPAGGCPDPEALDGSWNLETLGRIAEGVVHDFNNVLAAISGFAELMLQPAPAVPDASAGTGNHDAREYARMILQAALSGQGLVKDLRSLTRRDRREKEVLDLREVIAQSLAIARGSLGPCIDTVVEFGPGPARVQGCRGLLQNAFINLLLNARDAMPRGGRILLRTELLPAARGPGRPAVAVTVRDSGEGMPPEVLERVFEPRFTTKGSKGSGLGLANVLRTVRLHQGSIDVTSARGAGTEFRILLPRCD